MSKRTGRPRGQKVSFDEAQRVIQEHRAKRLKELEDKINELLKKYGAYITASFMLFGQTIDPPVKVVLGDEPQSQPSPPEPPEEPPSDKPPEPA